MNICFWVLVLHFVLEAIIDALENKLEYDKFKIISVIFNFVCWVLILYRAVKIGF